MKLKISLFVSIGLLMFSCSNELDKRIQKISYGTSFGECMGYCRHQMLITVDSVKYSCISNGNTLLQKDFYEKTTSVRWDSIRSDLTVSSFFAIPAVNGCPDCADGGAEWLEILFDNGESHKVTFEYRNEPSALKAYVSKCRLILSKNSCQ